MKRKLSKKEIEEEIKEFFSKGDFSVKEVRKIKRFAMKHNVKLRIYRRRFCKKCLHELKGKTRVGKTHKSVECSNCGFKNRFILKRRG